MDEYERALLEKLAANVEVLRSAVALLICSGLSDDALKAYRETLPSTVVGSGTAEDIQPFDEASRHLAGELNLHSELVRGFRK
jgi:hypothetical protein